MSPLRQAMVDAMLLRGFAVRTHRICYGCGLRVTDYRHHDRWKTLHLAGEELTHRFLVHVLPKGLMRIRHYGFLANRCRKEKLAKIR